MNTFFEDSEQGSEKSFLEKFSNFEFDENLIECRETYLSIPDCKKTPSGFLLGISRGTRTLNTLRWRASGQWACVESNRAAISVFIGTVVCISSLLLVYFYLVFSETEHYLVVSGHGRFTIGSEENDVIANGVRIYLLTTVPALGKDDRLGKIMPSYVKLCQVKNRFRTRHCNFICT